MTFSSFNKKKDLPKKKVGKRRPVRRVNDTKEMLLPLRFSSFKEEEEKRRHGALRTFSASLNYIKLSFAFE